MNFNMLYFRNYAFCLIFSICLIVSRDAWSLSPLEQKPKPIKIANILIENLQENKAFPYDRVWQEIIARLDVPVRTFYYPPARALSYFFEGHFDCVFPAEIRYLAVKGNYLQTSPVNYAKVYLVSKKQGKHYQDDNFSNLDLVAVQRGYTYGGKINELPENKRLVVNNIEQQIGLLMKGRADAFLVFVPDLYLVIDQKLTEKLWFEKGSPLSVHQENLVCWENESTRQLINSTDAILKKLQLDDLLGTASTHKSSNP